MTNRTHAGFTLIEVMIATVIMFSVLSFVALSFKSAQQTSQKVSEMITMMGPVPMIVDTIRHQIRENTDLQAEIVGAGSVLGMQYQWRAQRLEYRQPPNRFDPDLGAFVDYAPRFHLYEIELTLARQNKSRTFTYKELAWSDLQQK